MKRYFLVHDDHMPKAEDDFGHFHYIELNSHGSAGENWNLMCLMDTYVSAPKEWIGFPPIYDSRTTLEASAVPHEALADIGLTGAETTIEAVVALSGISPLLGF